jgi:hypothetical protein
MTLRTHVERRRGRARNRERRCDVRAWLRSAFRRGTASIQAVAFRVHGGSALLSQQAPGWARSTLAVAALLGCVTAACGDRYLDAIKMPPEETLGGSGGSGGAVGTGGTSSDPAGGKHNDHPDSGGWTGSAGEGGRSHSGGTGFGGSGGTWPSATGGDPGRGGRSAGGGDTSSGGRGAGGRSSGGSGEWPTGGGGTGGKEPWYTGGSTGSGTGGVGGGPSTPVCPETMPDSGPCSLPPQFPPCQYDVQRESFLCSCKEEQWTCAKCPGARPDSSSYCPIETATCWYDPSAVCYCAMDSTWVCADTEAPSGAAGASGAGGEGGAGGSAGAPPVPSSCPDAAHQPRNGRACDQYGRGVYCEYGPYWWCLCTGRYGWYCSDDRPDQNIPG